MNLRVLEYVIAGAEHGGVTRAGEELRVSEPALSKASRSKGSSRSRCRPKAPWITCRNGLRDFMRSIGMFASESPQRRESWACWTSRVPQADLTSSIHFLNSVGFGF